MTQPGDEGTGQPAGTPETVTVALGERSYPVVVGRGLLSGLVDHVEVPAAATRAALVTQPPVAERYAGPVASALRGAGLEVHLLEVPDGEGAKDLGVLAELYDACAELPLGRRDLVVAVGGGVVGDLAGFLAATWNRGVPVLQVPTTLLAQVDAAIGGKTAVNLPQGKNLVGAFHQPVAVVADVTALATLEPRVLVEGLGEVVKHGLIADPTILDLLEERPRVREADDAWWQEVVVRSARVKAEVVAADEREAGRRAHLNLGHTYGHAVESLSGYRGVLHGEAVAVGIHVALRLGRRLDLTPAPVVERGRDLLEAVGLPTVPPDLDPDEVWTVMTRDKKARAGRLRFVLLEEVARPVVVPVDRLDVEAAIDAARKD